MEETFTALGGKIEYRTKVEKVLIENGKVKGVHTSKGDFEAESVIVSQDTRAAIDQLFEKPLEEKWTAKMKKNLLTDQNIFISLGVKADLSSLPYAIVLPLKKPLEYAGCKWTEIRLNNYARYKDHSPEGTTSITCLLIGDTYSFWKNAKADGTYKAKKEELCKLFVDAVAEFIPQVKSELEVTDVATPLTYERYTGAFEGSWMSVYKPGGSQDNYPQECKSVEGLYFAGLRTMMPGGLPIAVYTGRQAVQYLCRKTKTLFL
jgi:phytoene dehydrogenase-like protein